MPPIKTTTSFGNAPPSFSQTSISQNKQTGALTQTERRGNLFGGHLISQNVGFGSPRESPLDVERRRAEAAAREQSRLSELVAKSEKQLLTPQERAELKQLAFKTTTPTLSVTPRLLAGKTPEQARIEQNRATIQRQTQKFESEAKALETQQKELENRSKVLNRLAKKGLLQAGSVQKFNKDVQNYIQSAGLFNARVKGFNRIVEKAQQLETRAPATALIGLGLKATKTPRTSSSGIASPIGFKEIGQRIVETEKAGAEFGKFAARTAGTPFLESGAGIVGGTLGRAAGTIEAIPTSFLDQALFRLEKQQGRPAELRLRAGSLEESGVKIVAGIPFVGELSGAKQAVTKTGGVKITRPVIREFATSLLFFAGPSVARVGTTGVKSVEAVSLKTPRVVKGIIGRTPKTVAIQETGGVLRVVGKLAPEDIQFGTRARRLTKPSLLKEVKGILGRQPPKPITVFERPVSLKGGNVVLGEVRPSIVGEISPRQKFLETFKLGESGRLGRGRTIQVESPKSSRVESLNLTDNFEELLSGARIKRFGVPSAFRVPIALTQGTAVRRALSPREIVFSFPKTFFGSPSIARTGSVTKLGLFFGNLARTGSLTRPVSATTQGQRSSTASISIPRIAVPSVPRIIPRERASLKTKIVSRTIPKKPFLVLSDFPEFSGLPSQKVSSQALGFNVFVKRGGKFRRISPFALTRESALGLGAREVRGFGAKGLAAARTFFITPTSKVGRELKGVTGFFKPEQFRGPKGKSKLPRQSFVEKSIFALDTKQEKISLQEGRKRKQSIIGNLKGIIGPRRSIYSEPLLRLPGFGRNKIFEGF